MSPDLKVPILLPWTTKGLLRWLSWACLLFYLAFAPVAFNEEHTIYEGEEAREYFSRYTNGSVTLEKLLKESEHHDAVEAVREHLENHHHSEHGEDLDEVHDVGNGVPCYIGAHISAVKVGEEIKKESHSEEDADKDDDKEVEYTYTTVANGDTSKDELPAISTYILTETGLHLRATSVPEPPPHDPDRGDAILFLKVSVKHGEILDDSPYTFHYVMHKHAEQMHQHPPSDLPLHLDTLAEKYVSAEDIREENPYLIELNYDSNKGGYFILHVYVDNLHLRVPKLFWKYELAHGEAASEMFKERVLGKMSMDELIDESDGDHAEKKAMKKALGLAASEEDSIECRLTFYVHSLEVAGENVPEDPHKWPYLDVYAFEEDDMYKHITAVKLPEKDNSSASGSSRSNGSRTESEEDSHSSGSTDHHGRTHSEQMNDDEKGRYDNDSDPERPPFETPEQKTERDYGAYFSIRVNQQDLQHSLADFRILMHKELAYSGNDPKETLTEEEIQASYLSHSVEYKNNGPKSEKLLLFPYKHSLDLHMNMDLLFTLEDGEPSGEFEAEEHAHEEDSIQEPMAESTSQNPPGSAMSQHQQEVQGGPKEASLERSNLDMGANEEEERRGRALTPTGSRSPSPAPSHRGGKEQAEVASHELANSEHNVRASSPPPALSPTPSHQGGGNQGRNSFESQVGTPPYHEVEEKPPKAALSPQQAAMEERARTPLPSAHHQEPMHEYAKEEILAAPLSPAVSHVSSHRAPACGGHKEVPKKRTKDKKVAFSNDVRERTANNEAALKTRQSTKGTRRGDTPSAVKSRSSKKVNQAASSRKAAKASSDAATSKSKRKKAATEEGREALAKAKLAGKVAAVTSLKPSPLNYWLDRSIHGQPRRQPRREPRRKQANSHHQCSSSKHEEKKRRKSRGLAKRRDEEMRKPQGPKEHTMQKREEATKREERNQSPVRMTLSKMFGKYLPRDPLSKSKTATKSEVKNEEGEAPTTKTRVSKAEEDANKATAEANGGENGEKPASKTASKFKARSTRENAKKDTKGATAAVPKVKRGDKPVAKPSKVDSTKATGAEKENVEKVPTRRKSSRRAGA